MVEKLRSMAIFSVAKLRNVLEAMFAFSLKRPRTVVVCFLAAVIFFTTWIPGIRTYISPEDTIGSKFVSIEEMKLLKKEFKLGNKIQLVFKRKDQGVFHHDDICKIYDAVEKEAFVNHDLEEINSPLHLRKGQLAKGIFSFPFVLDYDCENPNSIARHASLVYLDALSSTPWNLLVTDKSSHDLLFEFSLRDEEHCSLGDFDPAKVGVLVDRLTSDLNRMAPQIEAIPTGYAFYKYHTLVGFTRQNGLNLLMMVLLALVTRLCFGRWLASLLLLFSLTLMSLILYGTMVILNMPIDMLTVGLFLIVSIAAVQDFLFVSFHLLKHDGHWRDSLHQYLLPSFLTSFTTVVGFGSLCSSNLETIQRFGFLAAYGALLEWFIIFFFFPALFSLFPTFKNWVRPSKAISLSFFERLARIKPNRKMIIVMIIAFVLSPLSILTFKVTDDPKTIFPEHHIVNTGLDYLLHSRGWLSTNYLVFRDREAEPFNRAVIASLGKHEYVKFLDDPYAFVDFFSRGLPTHYRPMINAALSGSSSYSHYFSREGRALATVYLDTYSLDAVASLLEWQKSLCPHGECMLLGPMVSQYEFSQKVIPTLTESLALSLVLVITTLWLLCLVCHEKHIAAVIFSSIWGAVTVISFIKFFNMNINYVVCVFASALVGIAGDNAVQYLFNGGGANHGGVAVGIQQKGAGSTQIATITILLSLLMLGAAFKPVRTLGLLFACGVLLALAGDLWLLSGLIKLSKKRVNDESVS